MPTELLPTREDTTTTKKVAPNLALAITLHLLIAAVIAGAAYISHKSNIHWGERDPLAGAMQVQAVTSLPLPPRQRFKENEVLASDKPSIAPTPPPPAPPSPKAKAPTAPKAEPPPKPNEVLIPTKARPDPIKPAPTKPAPTPPAKPAAAKPEPSKPVDTPPAHTTPAPPTPKATTGETSGIQIPQSVVQTKTGISAIAIEERSFGDRFAYYVKLIQQAIQRAKQQEPDGPETRGKRTILKFTIDRDGAPTEVEVVTRSGSPALDLSTQRAIQRIDTFGPLPAGFSHVNVNFGYTSQ